MNHNILSTVLSLCLCGGGVALALDKPVTPPPAKEAANETGRRIAAETAAAIKELGRNPSPKQIATIVFKAVRSSPESVLLIVDAAVRVSPQLTVTEIVTAATAALRDPWKQVIYRRLATVTEKKGTTNSTGGRTSAQTRDGRRSLELEPGQAGLSIALSANRSSGPGTEGADAANGIPMTLAEAIIRTAFDSEAGLSLAALQEAVNVALRMDPATLMRSIESPRAASGVGDAGQNSYVNEPLRTPLEPVVSR